MEMVMTLTDAIERASGFQPVEVKSTGEVGIAVDTDGESVRVAFTDGRVLWFHLSYVRAVVNV